MDEETRALLIQVAGFLNLIAKRAFTVPEHASKEAAEILEKIGKRLA